MPPRMNRRPKGTVGVVGEGGKTQQIPAWMLSSEAEAYSLSKGVTISKYALLSLVNLLECVHADGFER